jgi:hypothetical protein
MAVTLHPEVWALPAFRAGPAGTLVAEAQVDDEVYPYPSLSGGYASVYINKAWDTAKGGWVFWSTEFEDVDGLQYPGPGIFGVHTSRYRVESITFAISGQ